MLTIRKTIGKRRRKAAILARHKVVFSQDVAEGAQGDLPNYTWGGMKPETVSSEVPAFSVQAAACAEASEASSQRDNTYVLVCAELKLVCTSKNAQTASPEACHGTRWEPRSCILVFNWPVKQPSATLLRELLREVYHQASKLRRYALHSRDQMGRPPYLSVTIPTCWFELELVCTSKDAHTASSEACHGTCWTPWSCIHVFNWPVKQRSKTAAQIVSGNVPPSVRGASGGIPPTRWGGSPGPSMRRHFSSCRTGPPKSLLSSGRGGMKLMSEKALKKCFLHPDEESQMGGCVRDLSVIASIQRGTDFQFQFFRQQATLASIVSGERFLQDPGLEPEAERTVVQRIDRSIPSMKMIFLVRVKLGALRTCRHGCSPDLPDVSIHHVFLDMLQWGGIIIRARSWEAHLWFVVGHSFMDAVLGHDYEHSRSIWSFQQFLDLPGYEHMDMRESYTGDFYDHQWPCWWWTL